MFQKIPIQFFFFYIIIGNKIEFGTNKTTFTLQKIPCLFYLSSNLQVKCIRKNTLSKMYYRKGYPQAKENIHTYIFFLIYLSKSCKKYNYYKDFFGKEMYSVCLKFYFSQTVKEKKCLENLVFCSFAENSRNLKKKVDQVVEKERILSRKFLNIHVGILKRSNS